jgi:hypothetical protein
LTPYPTLTNRPEAKGKSIVGAHSIEEFVSKLKKPRRMMMLVMAGKPVDDFIELLLAGGVEKDDIIIDGGNSHYPDTNRRTRYLKEKGIRFVGTGVSGGEEGARYGPSIMPGGNEGTFWCNFSIRFKHELILAQRLGHISKLVELEPLPNSTLTIARTFYNPSPPSQMARPAVSGSVTRVLVTT